MLLLLLLLLMMLLLSCNAGICSLRRHLLARCHLAHWVKHCYFLLVHLLLLHARLCAHLMHTTTTTRHVARDVMARSTVTTITIIQLVIYRVLQRHRSWCHRLLGLSLMLLLLLLDTDHWRHHRLHLLMHSTHSQSRSSRLSIPLQTTWNTNRHLSHAISSHTHSHATHVTHQVLLLLLLHLMLTRDGTLLLLTQLLLLRWNGVHAMSHTSSMPPWWTTSVNPRHHRGMRHWRRCPLLLLLLLR